MSHSGFLGKTNLNKNVVPLNSDRYLSKAIEHYFFFSKWVRKREAFCLINQNSPDADDSANDINVNTKPYGVRLRSRATARCYCANNARTACIAMPVLSTVDNKQCDLILEQVIIIKYVINWLLYYQYHLGHTVCVHIVRLIYSFI